MSDFDPNLRRTFQGDRSRAAMWAGILLAGFVVLVGLIMLMPGGTNTTATGPQPASPPATTGSGTTGGGTTNAPSR